MKINITFYILSFLLTASDSPRIKIFPVGNQTLNKPARNPFFRLFQFYNRSLNFFYLNFIFIHFYFSKLMIRLYVQKSFICYGVNGLSSKILILIKTKP